MTKTRVAIIGSGITGASCAYFLNELFNDAEIQIDVYEKSECIGGRLATHEYNGREYETGGSILHPSNFYMDEFRKLFGLEKLVESKRRSYFLGLFDSKSIVFSNSSLNWDPFGIVEKINFIKSYGFVEIFMFFKWLWALVKDFERIYKLQDDGETFHSIEEFLKLLGDDLYQASKVSTRSLLERQKFSERIIHELANVSTLANYGQDANSVNGFVGLVSLAAISAELWCVKGGNKQIPVNLLERSGANVFLNTTVKSIDPRGDHENNLTLHDGRIVTYDYVVLAFPLTKSSEIRLNFNYTDHLKYELHFNQASLVDGNVHLFPDLPLDRRIELFSCDPSVDCRIITTQLPCDYSEQRDEGVFTSTKVYKTFSPHDLTDDMLKKVFKPGYRVLTKCNWSAFPKYTATQHYPRIHIDSRERSRVFYANSMEWAASCMETCCIAGRNVALLVSNMQLGARKRGKLRRKSNGSQSLLLCLLIIITSVLVAYCYF